MNISTFASDRLHALSQLICHPIDISVLARVVLLSAFMPIRQPPHVVHLEYGLWHRLSTKELEHAVINSQWCICLGSGARNNEIQKPIVGLNVYL